MNEFAGASILVVDDEPSVRHVSAALLSKRGYRCSEAASEAEALAAVAADPPDLVLTDVSMPGGSGISLVHSLYASHPDVATVMVTARDDPEIADEAIDGGAYGYVIKPFETNELMIAVAGALKRRALVIENRAHRNHLEELVRRRTRELDESWVETVERLARAIESRDRDTGAHIERMSRIVYRVACTLGWDERAADTLRLASILHDIGKVAVPDGILLKNGPLTDGERRLVQTHPSVGHAILAGARSELLQLADVVAWTHHERIDGSGYPRALVGGQIPVAGRIAAVADVFDALTSDRPYSAALSVSDALELIENDPGLDPAAVEALVSVVASGVGRSCSTSPRSAGS